MATKLLTLEESPEYVKNRIYRGVMGENKSVRVDLCRYDIEEEKQIVESLRALGYNVYNFFDTEYIISW